MLAFYLIFHHHSYSPASRLTRTKRFYPQRPSGQVVVTGVFPPPPRRMVFVRYFCLPFYRAYIGFSLPTFELLKWSSIFMEFGNSLGMIHVMPTNKASSVSVVSYVCVTGACSKQCEYRQQQLIAVLRACLTASDTTRNPGASITPAALVTSSRQFGVRPSFAFDMFQCCSDP